MPQSPPQRVVRAACLMFGLSLAELRGDGRSWAQVSARQWAAVRLCRELGLSKMHAGRLLNRDHATVINLLCRADGLYRDRTPRWREHHVTVHGKLPT